MLIRVKLVLRSDFFASPSSVMQATRPEHSVGEYYGSSRYIFASSALYIGWVPPGLNERLAQISYTSVKRKDSEPRRAMEPGLESKNHSPEPKYPEEER